jgi:hypothetical protein
VPSASDLRFAWYRFRCTFGQRWTGYLALVLLLGLVGGLALGSLAAARRTQAAFPAYLASTNPSDLTVLTGSFGDAGSSGYDPVLIAKIAALPGVRHVTSYVGLNVAVLAPDGSASGGAGPVAASVDGEFFSTDRVTIVAGRMADPGRPDEAVIDALGTPPQVHVGDVAAFGFYTDAQAARLNAGQPVKPVLRINVTVVGKAVFSSEGAQDDVDTMRNGGPLFTPALARQLAACCSSYTETAVQLTEDGNSAVEVAERRIQQVLPPGFPVEFYVTSATEGKAQRAVEPTSIALAVFGGIAGLAALVIAGQVIGRQLRLGAGDLTVLRALGSRPAGTVCDSLLGVVCAVAAGALLAGVLAVGLSPIAPLGPVRPVYPFRGVAFDWTVLGGGAGVFIAVLSLLAVGLARRQAPHRAARALRPGPGSGTFWVRAARTCGLPASAAEGIRLALDPGSGRRSVPLRSAIGGTAAAIVVLIATVTFGASLQTLVSHPALYGWNWTFALNAGSPSYIATNRAGELLSHDPAVAAWTGIYFATARIDGQTVPVLGMSPHSPVAPPLLSGHGLETTGQVVLGSATLAQLHKRVGDAVTVQDSGSRTFRLRIAGTATLPSLGASGTLHTEMGTGAVFSYQLIPGAVSGQPNEILVSLRPGADPGAARTRLQRLVPAVNGGTVSGVQRPAEIVGYRTMGTAPVLLAAALALGAISSVWLALMASVRHRRKDLALLKTLGFTRRQLAATVGWQATVTVIVGTAVGIPLGIGLGRFLWDLFARQIDVVPEPIVPVPTVAVVIAGALLIANLLALLPGRAAGRTPAAALLRSE